MTKTIKSSMGKLWKAQYAPRESFIKRNLNKPQLSKWNKQTTLKKIIVIDNLQSKGFFKKKR